MRLAFAATLATTLLVGAAQAAVTETFEGLPTNGDLNGQSILGGLATISSSTNVLRVYDTSAKGGRDKDLEYANSGSALILQRPHRKAATNAPDDDANGGKFRIDLVGAPQDFLSITLFDFEKRESAIFKTDKGVIGTINGTAREFSNAKQTAASTIVVSFAGLANPENALGAQWLEIHTNASTAFDDVVATPIPGAALLLGSGLAALGYVRRRRTTA